MALSLYKAATTIGTPIILAAFIVRSIRQKAYRERLKERLGFGLPSAKGGIVIHGASVGEITTLSPIVEKLLKQYPNSPITVTSFTPTGSAQVRKKFGERVEHCYIPLDSPGSAKRFIHSVAPQLLVLMETEIWPSLIEQAHRFGTRILLINGRISDRSFPRYKKIQGLIQPSLAMIDRILTQSDTDRRRFETLGAKTESIAVSGNIKFDLVESEDGKNDKDSIKHKLNKRQIWVVGSSHEDEETLLLQSFSLLMNQFPNILLVIAPRHPERIKPLENAFKEKNWTYVLRSEKQIPDNENIWLIDTMGELLFFYSIADIVTIAGSFGKTGGHNPLEAALFRKPITVGTNMANFRDIQSLLSDGHGIQQLEENTADALSQSVTRLLNDPQLQNTLGENGYRVLAQNQGATQITLDTIDSLINMKSGKD